MLSIKINDTHLPFTVKLMLLLSILNSLLFPSFISHGLADTSFDVQQSWLIAQWIISIIFSIIFLIISAMVSRSSIYDWPLKIGLFIILSLTLLNFCFLVAAWNYNKNDEKYDDRNNLLMASYFFNLLTFAISFYLLFSIMNICSF